MLKPSIGRVGCIDKDEPSVTMEISKQTGVMYMVIVVYASTNIVLRRDLWSKVVNLSYSYQLPWMVLRDFNSILSSQEKVGGAEIRPYHFADFLFVSRLRGLLI